MAQFTRYSRHMLPDGTPIEAWVECSADLIGTLPDGGELFDWSTLRWERWALYDPRTATEQAAGLAVVLGGVGVFAVQDSKLSDASPPASPSDWNNINKPTSDQITAAGLTLAAVSFVPRS